MIDIVPAVAFDVDARVTLEAQLFGEDSGVHDPLGDTTWPARKGANDFHQLLNDPDSVVLIARDADVVVGMLIG